MSTEKQPDAWKELRKPFPKEVIGQLPRGGIKLDYVGHAAVTDRLLTVDPKWTWEPLAVDENGLPAYDRAGGLWIKLTVNGVTRLGYGDGADPKIRIGDALRNAAMRFGVALDLWTKDELESTLAHPELKNEKPSARKSGPKKATQEQISRMLERARDASGLTDRQAIIKWFEDTTGFLPTEILMDEVDGVLDLISAEAPPTEDEHREQLDHEQDEWERGQIDDQLNIED